MNCHHFKKDLHTYFTGQLDPARITCLLSHARECADCERLMAVAKEMTCKEFTELLNDFVDGALPAGRRRTFDRHLSMCSDCTAYLQSYRATMKMSAIAMRTAMRRVSEEMPEKLIGAILAARAEEERLRGG